MSDVSAIRAELAAILDTIPGLYTSAFFPDLITVPMAIVGGPEINYDDDTMSDVYDFPVTLLVSTNTDRKAQQQLDGFCASSSATSVRGVVEVAMPSTVQVLVVTKMFEYGTHEIQNIRYLGCTFMVHAVAYR